MAALGEHVVLGLEDGRVLLRDTRERRVFAAAVHRIGDEFGLLAAGAADNHAHVTLVCDRRQAGEFAHRVECSLQWGLGLDVSFAPARIRDIEDQYHLQNSFFYDLKQFDRHGLAGDPFHESSSLPDLLGLRVLDTGIRQRVSSYLPRVRRERLEDFLPRPLAEQPLVLECLADATAAAFGLVDLHGHRRGAEIRRAVVAAVHAADQSAAKLAAALDCSRRFVMKARREDPDRAAIEAVLGQWRLRSPGQPQSDFVSNTQRSPVSWVSGMCSA
jgi:hypothetical protein